jgi:hypothetical protein
MIMNEFKAFREEAGDEDSTHGAIEEYEQTSP